MTVMSFIGLHMTQLSVYLCTERLWQQNDVLFSNNIFVFYEDK